MAEAAHTHPDDLQSDLTLLVEMAREPRRDEEALRRHLESLKGKLDKFIHESGTGTGDG
jgi:hypothetical protein